QAASKRATEAVEHDCVDRDVDQEQTHTEDELIVPGEGGRIEDGKDIVLHEVTRVAGGASSHSERVLKRGGRADPPGELDECAPGDCGHVKPRKPAPTKHQQSAEYGESHERGMNDEH